MAGDEEGNKRSPKRKQTTLDAHLGPPTRAKSAKGLAQVAPRGLTGTLAGMHVEKRVTRSADAPRKSVQVAAAAKAPPPEQQQLQKAKAAAATAAAARRPAPGSAQRKQSPAKEGKRATSKAGRHYLSQVERDEDNTLRVGDIAYVVLDERCLDLSEGEEEEDCRCLMCGSAEKEEEVMLECSRCLAGWHLACLDPPLTQVPQDDWLCADCVAGKPVPPRAATCSRERFLQQQGLGLGKVETLWEEADGEQQCIVRWFEVPEKTHRGRQASNAAREVYLTQQRDQVPVDSLGRAAHVLPNYLFNKGGDALGDDVFLCDYNYDTVYQRFTRTELDSDSKEDEDNWCPSSDDEPEEEDRERAGKPVYAAWMEKGLIKPKCMRGAINRRTKKMQGGGAFLDQVGALEIPDHVRQGRRAGGAPTSALAQARDALMLTAVPATLPCREPERREVEQFVQEVLDDAGATGCGRCLYVCGIPGTGKTATVLEVMRSFKRRVEEGSAPSFQFVEINGLRLPSPQHAYSSLYEALTGDRVGPQTAAQLLDEMMSSGNKSGPRRPTIVLVDEMDLLINRTQTVLYNLFDWPGRKGSRLSIIGIANTMDLPERLHQRIGSRLAGRRVVFHPYKTEQLEQIIVSRLEGLTAFDPKAVKLVSQKVANCSGDVRRCLELCRRSAEIAEERWLRQQKQEHQQGGGGSSSVSRAGGAPSSSNATEGSQQKEENGTVQMRHVHAAVQEMFNTSHVIMIKAASRLERLLLAALHLEARFSGRTEALLEDVADRLKLLCTNNMEHQYEFGAVLESAVRLGSKRLILADPGFKRLKMKLSLNVPVNDLLHALKNDMQIRWLADRLDAAA